MTSRAKQELLKECDEQIKMCNTMSFIGGCDTIAQYKIKKIGRASCRERV